MSVYTPLSYQQVDDFITQYERGTLKTFHDVEAGVTNTIYYIETQQSPYILVLFEELTQQELPFYLDLTDFLSNKKLPCARIIANSKGERIFTLANKPTVLMEFLPGETLASTNSKHCRAIGHMLATMHMAAIDFPQQQANPRGAVWREATAAELYATVDETTVNLLREEISFAKQHSLSGLPQGVIHADLFRDNVLFVDSKISGLLDFYYACYDALSYDLAIVVNDWCFTADDQFDRQYYDELLSAYQSVRPFTDFEKKNWLATLRQAALRFWLSRLHDDSLSCRGPLIHKKDPDTFKKRIEFYRGIAAEDVSFNEGLTFKK